MHVTRLDGSVALVRLPGGSPLPAWAAAALATTMPDGFASVTVAPGEVSVVVPAEAVPDALTDDVPGARISAPWVVLRLGNDDGSKESGDATASTGGAFPLDTVGVMARVASLLAAADVPLVPVGTFDTDFLLVPAARVRVALRALARGGIAERPIPRVLHVATGATPFGRLLVAVSPRGLAWASLGDTDAALLAALADSPVGRGATLVAGGAADAARRGLLRTLDGAAYDRPLDARGTPFQQRVWAALRAIPPGTTASYAEIARGLGMPGAARAVGSALAANPVALAIPCHRAVRGDARPTPFRWGTPRKEALLAHERGGQMSLFDTVDAA